jgi:AcrR family transcriptional regulator
MSIDPAAARGRRAPGAGQPNLDAKAWVAAAFDALAAGGVDAVRIDQLAKELGVTRGSFYWHFKNREALHQAMLREWRRRANHQIFVRVERSSEPAGTRLMRLMALPNATPRSARGASIELAVRLWARRDARVAEAVAAVDRTRLAYFGSLLRKHGVPEEEARSRAYLFYAYLMAEAIIVADKTEAMGAACRDLLLGE